MLDREVDADLEVTASDGASRAADDDTETPLESDIAANGGVEGE